MPKHKLNTRLLKKVRNRIAELPESFDQRYYYLPTKASPCGFLTDITGMVIICSAPSIEQGIWKLATIHEKKLAAIFVTAQNALKLTIDEALMLFTTPRSNRPITSPRWPKPFHTKFLHADSVKGRAKVTVAYLDHILKTGKILE